MRAMTKMTTGVAAGALALAGLFGVVGTANATGPSAGVTIPGAIDVTLTGKIVKVEGKYVTVVLDSGRKVVVELGSLTTVIGDITSAAKVKITAPAVDALLSLFKAKTVVVIG